MSSKHVPSEDSQLAILASDASLHDKAVACQRLVYVAGPRSVAPLAALLGDPKLSDYARSGLEAIDDPAASRALLDALPKLEGRLLAGVVNSLGVRREEKATAPLQQLAKDDGKGVRTEAIASLGLIATPEAAATLLAAIADTSGALQTAAGHASLLAIGTLRSEGEKLAADTLVEALTTAFPKGPIHEAAKRLAAS